MLIRPLASLPTFLPTRLAICRSFDSFHDCRSQPFDEKPFFFDCILSNVYDVGQSNFYAHSHLFFPFLADFVFHSAFIQLNTVAPVRSLCQKNIVWRLVGLPLTSADQLKLNLIVPLHFYFRHLVIRFRFTSLSSRCRFAVAI